eukprot:TRINITY_DN29856_c0_g1_i1.p1 TRINITY_DN29856_c0_g1~~TRINITY_DN29856_c0_g1_i1.p1  ORF type:complete len:570 (+),score=151.90 TRINITY_DN29856_c0_g1_i1:44-1753(+)
MSLMATAERLAWAVSQQAFWDAGMKAMVLNYTGLEEALAACVKDWSRRAAAWSECDGDVFTVALQHEVRGLDLFYEERMCRFIEKAEMVRNLPQDGTCREQLEDLRQSVKALRTWVDVNHIALVHIHDAYTAAAAAHLPAPRSVPWLFERTFFMNDTGLSMLVFELSTVSAKFEMACQEPLPTPGRDCTTTPEVDDKIKEVESHCYRLVPGWCHKPRLLVRVLTGGLTNHLYTAELTEASADAPQRVVVRFFGGGELIDRAAESKVAAALQQQGMGVTIYGEFPGGRIESFADGQPLRFYHLGRFTLLRGMAKEFARLHQLDVPGISREPQVLRIIDDYLTQAAAVSFDDEVQEIAPGPAGLNALPIKKKEALAEMKQMFNWAAEVANLRAAVNARDMEVTFCHCDMQEGNLLVKDPKAATSEILVIDYEYARYDYAAFDIANFMCEAYIDNFFPEYPFFRCNHVTVPDYVHRRHLLTLYLLHRGLITSSGTSDTVLRRWLDDVHLMMQASHLLWGLWAVVQAKESSISEFCYLSYGKMRLAEYMRLKQEGQPGRTRAGYSSSPLHVDA